MSKYNNLPEKLNLIIRERSDLMNLKLLEKNNERKLTKWLVKNGFILYPELLKGNFKNNEILFWLKSYSRVKGFEKIPRIILAIWDTHPLHRKNWMNVNDKSYSKWLKENWNEIKLEIPAYSSFFDVKFYAPSNFLFTINTIIDSTFFRNILIQVKVINALIYREIRLRIVKNNLGYIGLFTETLASLITFIIIRILLGLNVGMDFTIFLSFGIIFVNLFRKVAIVSINSSPNYDSLSMLTRVKPIDVFISLTLLEKWLTVILLIFVIVFSYMINQSIFMNNIAVLILSFLYLVIFSFSCGLFFKIVSNFFPAFPKITTWLNRFIFVGSATFYSLNDLPQFIKPFLSWNPILQSVELSRWSVDKNYFIEPTYISLNYLSLCSIISVSVSLTLYAFFEKDIIKK